MTESRDLELALRAVPAKWGDPPKDMVSKLPKGGDKDKNSWRTCRTCGGWHAANAVHLDYMGHADVTLALIDVDPQWEWHPMAFTPEGLPLISVNKGTATMWIHLTVLGKTLPAVGSCADLKEDRDKELIGDALRNGAMRFGIGTKLWSKTEGEASSAATDDPPTEPERGASGQRPPARRSTSGARPPARPEVPATPIDAAVERVHEAALATAGDDLRQTQLMVATVGKTDAQRQLAVAKIADRCGQLKGTLAEMLAHDDVWAAVKTEFGLS